MIFKLFSGDHVKISDLTREKMEEEHPKIVVDPFFHIEKLPTQEV
jgi:hypothetical protein